MVRKLAMNRRRCCTLSENKPTSDAADSWKTALRFHPAPENKQVKQSRQFCLFIVSRLESRSWSSSSSVEPKTAMSTEIIFAQKKTSGDMTQGLRYFGCESKFRDGHLQRYRRMWVETVVMRVLQVPIPIPFLALPLPVCGCVCVLFYDATAVSCSVTGPNAVNNSRRVYNPVRNTFDQFNSLWVCGLAGSEHLKQLCAGHKLVSDK